MPKKKPTAQQPAAAFMTTETVPVRADGIVKYVDLREAKRVRLVLPDGVYMDVEISRNDPSRIVVRGFPGPIAVYPNVSNMVEIADAGGQ